VAAAQRMAGTLASRLPGVWPAAQDSEDGGRRRGKRRWFRRATRITKGVPTLGGLASGLSWGAGAAFAGLREGAAERRTRTRGVGGERTAAPSKVQTSFFLHFVLCRSRERRIPGLSNTMTLLRYTISSSNEQIKERNMMMMKK
jgi:hypothetical protein